MSSLVSALMPTYNRREFLPRAFRCFQSQNYDALELIIIDDGTDNIYDLVPKDSRIRYYRMDSEGEEHQTHGYKMNVCMELAQGDIGIVWDDDDWYSPDRVSTQVEPFKNYYVQVTGNKQLYYYNKETREAFLYSPLDQRKNFTQVTFSDTEGERRFNELFQMSNWIGAIAFRKDAWKKHPFKDKKFGADTEFLKAHFVSELYDVEQPEILVCTAHKTNACRKFMMPPQYTKIPFELIENLTRGDL